MGFLIDRFQNMGTRLALAYNIRLLANAIKQRFISMGYVDTKLDSFTIINELSRLILTKKGYRKIFHQE